MIPDRQPTQTDLNRNQQNKLNQKLNERLGYSGVYSSRERESFFANLSELEQKKLLKKFKSIYAQILFNYFSDEADVNDLIDRFLMQSLMGETPKTALHRFVESAFFVNLPMNSDATHSPYRGKVPSERWGVSPVRRQAQGNAHQDGSGNSSGSN